MSSFVKKFSGGPKVREKPCQQVETEKRPEQEELLMKKKDFLKRKIGQELLFVKKNSRKNRRVALQALRRKKWYEKQVMYIDCAAKALRSAHEHIDVIHKVNDLIMNIIEEQDGTQDISDILYTSLSLGVEFDEHELLAELERLEKDLEESLFEKDCTEETVSCLKVSSTASPSHPAKTEQDEIEDDFEYLRRWANEP